MCYRYIFVLFALQQKILHGCTRPPQHRQMSEGHRREGVLLHVQWTFRPHRLGQDKKLASDHARVRRRG